MGDLAGKTFSSNLFFKFVSVHLVKNRNSLMIKSYKNMIDSLYVELCLQAM